LIVLPFSEPQSHSAASHPVLALVARFPTGWALWRGLPGRSSVPGASWRWGLTGALGKSPHSDVGIVQGPRDPCRACPSAPSPRGDGSEHDFGDRTLVS